MWNAKVIIVIIMLFANSAFAKNQRRVSTESRAATVVKTQQWAMDPGSVIKIKGSALGQEAQCSVFSVKLNKELSFKITCPGFEKSVSLLVESQAQYSVSQSAGNTTITKYAYLMKKPQVSQLEQAILKIPYVQEIIHLKRNKNGQLAFYYESFKVDEFGRIVQKDFVQAHSLIQSKVEITAN